MTDFLSSVLAAASMILIELIIAYLLRTLFTAPFAPRFLSRLAM